MHPQALRLLSGSEYVQALCLHSFFVDSIAKRPLTMKITIFCIIFLLCSSAASAETLYRWFEADGTITFSPEPPPKGIKFTTVESGALGSKNANVKMLAKMAEQVNTEDAAGSSLATSASALQRDTGLENVEQNTVARVQYAPETSKPFSRDQNVAISRNNPNRDSQEIVTQRSKSKPSRCTDLSKRVISLERRMRAGLSAEDMDNTVVAMAHYQRSYNQHCL